MERRRAVIADLLARERSEVVDVAGGPLLPDACATAVVFADTRHDAQASGQLRPDIEPGSAGRVLLDAYLGALIRWAADQDATTTASLRERFSVVLDTIINGLRPLRTTARA